MEITKNRNMTLVDTSENICCEFVCVFVYLESPEEIRAGLDHVAVFPEILASLFNLSSLFKGAGIRIKLPCLPPQKVICAVYVWIIPPLCNLKPPHDTASVTSSCFLSIEKSLPFYFSTG